MTFIYALSDPRTGVVRYIGKAKDPTERYSQHLSETRSRKTSHNNWIWSLMLEGFSPRLELLCQVPVIKWEECEQWYIAFYRRRGISLLNDANGGRGTSGFIPWNKGKKGRQKAWNKGLKTSSEIRAKQSAAHKGQPAWNKGKKMSEEYCQKNRESHLGIIPWNKGKKAKA